jgi:uncharacterized protein YbjT (DUF2867 family)
MSKKILGIGATGRVGRELVKLLVRNGEAVRAATRNPAELASRFQNTLEVVEFDYERPQTFAPALIGVDKIFLSVRPGDNHSDQYAIPLIDEAKKAKIQLIVDLTAMGTEQQETFMLRVLEKYVESSGIPFTHLRPNWFMQNFDSGPLGNDIRATSAMHLPAADASVSFVDVRDIASVAYATLTESHHIKKAYTLTGKEALSYFQVAEKLSHVSNRTISYVPITEEVARMVLAQRGVPDELVERWTDFYKKVRQGFCSPISTDIDSVIGRPPIAFDQYAMENSASWRINT